MNHTAIALAGMYAGMYAMDRWHNRPSARAKYARLGLGDKITYLVAYRRVVVAGHVAVLALLASLYAADILPFAGWMLYTTITGIYLAANLYILHRALAARRIYRNLGPLAYLAEIQHAFKALSKLCASSSGCSRTVSVVRHMTHISVHGLNGRTRAAMPHSRHSRRGSNCFHLWTRSALMIPDASDGKHWQGRGTVKSAMSAKASVHGHKGEGRWVRWRTAGNGACNYLNNDD